MKIFVEADSIALERVSGIGNATGEILRQFDELAKERSDIQVTAIVPYGRKSYVAEKYGFKAVRIRSLPPGYRYVNYLLTRTSIPVWPDLIYGRGLYVFPNYKTWSVPFSRSLTFVHDIAHSKFPLTTHPKNLEYLNANFDRWLKRATVIATISQSSVKDIAERYPRYKSKLKLVHLGVDMNYYTKRTEEEVHAALVKYELPSEYLLYVGSIEPRKNILSLLGAYKDFCDRNNTPLALVLIGGDGWNNEDIKQKIHDLKSQGYKIYHPSVYVRDEDLPAIYTGAFALVHAAIYEGFGLSLLQAMSCEIPVIAGNNSSIPEVTGKAALLTDVTSSHDICLAIEKLISSPELYAEMQAEGLLQASKFSWKRTSDTILSSLSEGI